MQLRCNLDASETQVKCNYQMSAEFGVWVEVEAESGKNNFLFILEFDEIMLPMSQKP